jgi:hypothetical protein
LKQANNQLKLTLDLHCSAGIAIFNRTRMFKNIKFNRLNDSSIQIEIHHWDGTFEKFNKEKNVKIDN